MRALAALLALAFLAGLLWILSAPPSLDARTLAEAVQPGDAKAGERVFYAGGCESCHMGAGQDDPLKLGGGRPLATPFGTFYPPNISPDPKDGLGNWSAEQFAQALLAGRSPGGDPYYPAFPYTSYTHMTGKDVRDLFAFLKTLPPVSGKAPPHAMSFPYNLRRGVGLWQRVFFSPGPLPDRPDLSATLARGRYLVDGPGHCGECHTPRNVAGALIADRRLTGGPAPDGKGKVPDITSAGLKDWTEDDVVDALTSGFTPVGDVLGGSMAAVVRNTARLPADDRKAIAAYLKSLGATKAQSP